MPLVYPSQRRVLFKIPQSNLKQLILGTSTLRIFQILRNETLQLHIFTEKLNTQGSEAMS